MRVKKLISMLLVLGCFISALSGCVVRDRLDEKGVFKYKVAEGYSYDNGCCAFDFDTSKFKASEVMDLGELSVFGVSVSDEAVISGDSEITVIVDKATKSTEDDIIDWLIEFIEEEFHVPDKTNIQTASYMDKNWVVGEYFFDTERSLYKIKALSKWGITAVAVCELHKEDKGNNSEMLAIFNSFALTGNKVDEEYMLKFD